MSIPCQISSAPYQHRTKTGNRDFFARFASIIYDIFLLIALLLFAFLPVPLLPETLRESASGVILSQVYFFLVIYLYFVCFWVKGGQTVGMKAWGLTVRSRSGTALSWGRASQRFLYAILSWLCFGLGFYLGLV